MNADLQKLADDGTVAELAEKYEIADMVTLKASDDASAEDSKDATDDAETDKTEKNKQYIKYDTEWDASRFSGWHPSCRFMEESSSGNVTTAYHGIWADAADLFLTLLFSLPLGMVVYFGRVSRFKPLSWIVTASIFLLCEEHH